MAGKSPIGTAGLSYVAGVLGPAGRIGSGGYVRYASAGTVSPSEGTFECWVRPDVPRDPTFHGVVFQVGAPFNDGLLISIDSRNILRFQAWGDNPATPQVEHAFETGDAVSNGGSAAGGWVHVAATWKGATGELRFYVDGQLVPVQPTLVLLAQLSGTQIVLGAELGTGARPLLGAPDEVRIPSRARTADEVARDFVSGLAATGLTAETDPLVTAPDGRIDLRTRVTRLQEILEAMVPILAEPRTSAPREASGPAKRQTIPIRFQGLARDHPASTPHRASLCPLRGGTGTPAPRSSPSASGPVDPLRRRRRAGRADDGRRLRRPPRGHPLVPQDRK